MSAKSRQREEEVRNARPLFENVSGADADDIAGQVITWDFERLLAVFVENRQEIADDRNCNKVVLDCDEARLVEYGRRPVGTICYAKQKTA